MRFFFPFFFCCCCFLPFEFLLAQTADVGKVVYRLYDAQGAPTSYAALLRAAQTADVVLFGELHDNPICHWLEAELTRDLHAALTDKLLLGGEMWEADQQLLVSEYTSGTISDKHFEEALQLWKNYKTDYKPILSFAQQNHIPLFATNIPRRYASLVFKNGIDVLNTLSNEAKSYIAPFPIAIDLSLPNYKAMLNADMGGHGADKSGENLPKAQAVKDATMAHFILKNWQKGKLFLHFNGAYHSNNREGIVWYLLKANPALKIITISSVEQGNIHPLEEESKQLADFIVCTPETLTKTH